MEFIDIRGRHTYSLNGKWSFFRDPYHRGLTNYQGIPHSDGGCFAARGGQEAGLLEYDFAMAERIHVPGDFNEVKGMEHYEGLVWYHREFEVPRGAVTGDSRCFLVIGAANYRCAVGVDGVRIGTEWHEGGFSQITVECTDAVRAHISRHGDSRRHFVVLAVDNARRAEHIPSLSTDWRNIGGVTRDVSLVVTPPTFIRRFQTWLSHDMKSIHARIYLDGEEIDRLQVTFRVEAPEDDDRYAGQFVECRIQCEGEQVCVQSELAAPAWLRLWSCETPFRHAVSVSIGQDRLDERVGYRTLCVGGVGENGAGDGDRETNEILLNGERMFLRGIAMHEEMQGLRRMATRDDARLMLGLVKELNANFVRLAHYQHNRHTVDLCDELGLIVWSELPVYWCITFDDDRTLQTAFGQLREMVWRDANRACVTFWSIANETPVDSPNRLRFLSALCEEARTIDCGNGGRRLLTAALLHRASAAQSKGTTASGDKVPELVIDDAFAAHLDVLSVNQYRGWYECDASAVFPMRWRIEGDESVRRKPVMVSEFGAGAEAGRHDERGATRWSEEYQAKVYREQFRMLGTVSMLRGLCPWLLMDFTSPQRPLIGLQDGFNRKGLVSERCVRKAAFYEVQRAYAAMEAQAKAAKVLSARSDAQRLRSLWPPYASGSAFMAPVDRSVASTPRRVSRNVPNKFAWLGYYDKFVTDPTDRYVLCCGVDFEMRSPTAADTIDVYVIDTHDNDRADRIGTSRAWSWQQGCMLQWLPGSESLILWNDRDEQDRLCARVYDFKAKACVRTLHVAVYCVSPDGTFALTLDFEWLAQLRPGYGYSAPSGAEPTQDRVGVARVDMRTGSTSTLVGPDVVRSRRHPVYGDLSAQQWWLNHLLVSPDSKRFIFLARWPRTAQQQAEMAPCAPQPGQPFGTRMCTARCDDGGDVHILDDYGETSHFIWRDARHVSAWTWHPSRGHFFYDFVDSACVQVPRAFGERVQTVNGHLTYLRGDRGEWRYVLNDTYADERCGEQHVYVYDRVRDHVFPVAHLAALPRYGSGEHRCDTHPRASRDARTIYVDSAHEGGRGLYAVEIRL